MKQGLLRDKVTFQTTYDDRRTWTDLFSCRAYINGVSGNEFFIANAGYDAALVVTVTCRYQPPLMGINPTVCRLVDGKGYVYELLSPGDDKQSMHREVIFRARRLMEGGGEAPPTPEPETEGDVNAET